MESEAITIREHLGRRSRVMFNLTMSAFAASFLGFLQKWPLMAAFVCWGLSLAALITFIIVGARMARCPRCRFKIGHHADQCVRCGVDFGEPLQPIPGAKGDLER